MKSIAGLRPWEYWDLTIMELAAMLSGVSEREEKAWEMVAWQTAHTINISGKSVRDRVSVDKLLGRTAKAFPMSNEDTGRELMRRQQAIDDKKRRGSGD